MLYPVEVSFFVCYSANKQAITLLGSKLRPSIIFILMAVIGQKKTINLIPYHLPYTLGTHMTLVSHLNFFLHTHHLLLGSMYH